MPNLKSVLKRVTAGANITAYVLAGAVAGSEIKNVYEHNPQANLEQRITKSDLKQMVHLDSLLDSKPDDLSSFDILKKFNGEEAIALHLSLHAYAMTNIALSDETRKDEAIKSIDKAITKYLGEGIKSNILEPVEGAKISGLSLIKKPDVKNNLFYFANLNLMTLAYERASGDKKYHVINETISKTMSEEFKKSGGQNLNSFPGVSWTADSAVALASLDLYDALNGASLSKEPTKNWKNWIKKEMLDEQGNLYSMMDSYTKKRTEEPKGSNFAYSLIFINMFDLDFSSELYDNFKKSFYKPILGVDFAKEWRDGSSRMDVDSGPVIFGAGAVASAFAIGASKAHQDEYHFSSLSLAAELATLPCESLSEKSYIGNVSLGESALLFSRTLRPWTK